jgi:hypothetical protein
MPENLAISITVCFISLSVVIIIGLRFYYRTQQMQIRSAMQADIMKELIDKLGSSQKFVEFLQTSAGHRLIASLSTEKYRPDAPEAAPIEQLLHRGILAAVPGTVLAVIGVVAEIDPLGVIGLVLLAIGIGFGLSAIVTHYWHGNRPSGSFPAPESISQEEA